MSLKMLPNNSSRSSKKMHVSSLHTQQGAPHKVAWTAESEGVVAVMPVQDEPDTEEATRPSRHQQKKFQRRFKIVAHEQLLNCFACYYGVESLIQGHLYTTQNYFAFYSNVLGYITKILIPMESVVAISREMTAKIIPNAVGISTNSEKYTFGFLRSRKTAYRLMVEVWENATGGDAENRALPSKGTPWAGDGTSRTTWHTQLSTTGDPTQDSIGDPPPYEDDEDGHESSLSGSELSRPPTPCEDIKDTTSSENRKLQPSPHTAPRKDEGLSQHSSFSKHVPTHTIMLKLTTGVVVLLSLASIYLMYRICRLYFQSSEVKSFGDSETLHQKLEWETLAHQHPAGMVKDFLISYTDKLSKVRQYLELALQGVAAEDQQSKKT